MTEGPRASPCSHHPARAPAFRPRLVTDLPAIWAVPADEIARRLDTSAEGLTSREAAARLAGYGPNELSSEGGRSRIGILLGQLKSPLLLILVFAAAVSGWSGEWADSTIVILILIASAGIGYLRESRAESAITALRSRILLRAQVRRDGQELSVPFREVVPGDVVLLSAGSLVPADGVLLDATDCFVNEAVLTGESFPAEKRPGAVLAAATPAPSRVNCAFMGTSVRSGFARLLVVKTGRATQFGDIAERLATRAPETEFDRGLRHFGYVLLVAMLVLVLAVFAANVLLGRPAVETLLFSIALAVGLSPELLPAILSVNLARGARAMADRGVLVRRLTAIENLGSMDILCTDKTGTLTEGVVQLEGAYDEDGRPSPRVLEMAACNAALQTGLANPLDEAILAARPFADPETQKLAEIPYDFVRKRLSVVVRGPAGESLVTKGAFASILGACTRTASGALLDAAGREALMLRFQEWAARGIRVLGVASRRLQGGPYGHDQERDLSFEGFLTFLDRPKTGVGAALSVLARLGVAVMVITGDSMLVAQHLAEAVGLGRGRVLTGVELDALHDEGLWQRAEATDVFAEVDPNQKERIIRALKKTGHVVGFLGDGVNDAPAMHAADTSLSVDQAADVAKEAADFVLLERDLDVIRGGVEEGRKTFANTLKYILTTTSANLGNMVSMAVASLALPFLPLLAGQVLLNNFLSDVPAMGIADDGVDPEIVARPRRWDMRMIGHFMVEFGLLSSAFDFLTFAVLLTAFVAPVELFRTAWFVESLLTELLIALVVRTRRPFYRSRPGKLLAVSTLAVAAAALAIPYLPGARVLGFAPLPASLVGAVLLITAFYVAATDRMKRSFFRRFA